MIQINNIRRFVDSVQAQRARLEQGITKAYQGHVRKVFRDLVEHSPQYSGSFAYNWNVVVKGENPGYHPWYKKHRTGAFDRWDFNPVQKGDLEAVGAAVTRAEYTIERIRWNSIVVFSNSDPTADLLESGEVILRPINVIPGYTTVTEYIRQKYLNRLRIE